MPKIKGNRYMFNNRLAVLYTSKGDHILVDIEDLPKVINYTWCLYPDGHAVTRVKGKEIRMHRLILDVPDDMDTDHKNHYRADNRKCNIRPCTVQENSRNRLCPKNNTTGVRGVTWCKASRKWRVRIMVDGENLNLGFYDEFEKAVQVRHTFERLFYGEFACIMPPVQM